MRWLRKSRHVGFVGESLFLTGSAYVAEENKHGANEGVDSTIRTQKRGTAILSIYL